MQMLSCGVVFVHVQSDRHHMAFEATAQGLHSIAGDCTADTSAICNIFGWNTVRTPLWCNRTWRVLLHTYNMTLDHLFLNIHYMFTNERISLLFEKHSHMSLIRHKGFFVEQISHLSIRAWLKWHRCHMSITFNLMWSWQLLCSSLSSSNEHVTALISEPRLQKSCWQWDWWQTGNISITLSHSELLVVRKSHHSKHCDAWWGAVM